MTFCSSGGRSGFEAEGKGPDVQSSMNELWSDWNRSIENPLDYYLRNKHNISVDPADGPSVRNALLDILSEKDLSRLMTQDDFDQLDEYKKDHQELNFDMKIVKGQIRVSLGLLYPHDEHAIYVKNGYGSTVQEALEDFRKNKKTVLQSAEPLDRFIKAGNEISITGNNTSFDVSLGNESSKDRNQEKIYRGYNLNEAMRSLLNDHVPSFDTPLDKSHIDQMVKHIQNNKASFQIQGDQTKIKVRMEIENDKAYEGNGTDLHKAFQSLWKNIGSSTISERLTHSEELDHSLKSGQQLLLSQMGGTFLAAYTVPHVSEAVRTSDFSAVKALDPVLRATFPKVTPSRLVRYPQIRKLEEYMKKGILVTITGNSTGVTIALSETSVNGVGPDLDSAFENLWMKLNKQNRISK